MLLLTPSLLNGRRAGAGGKEAAGIEEYSLSQTTLEQVFLLMARDGSQRAAGPAEGEAGVQGALPP